MTVGSIGTQMFSESRTMAGGGGRKNSKPGARTQNVRKKAVKKPEPSVLDIQKDSDEQRKNRAPVGTQNTQNDRKNPVGTDKKSKATIPKPRPRLESKKDEAAQPGSLKLVPNKV